MPAKAIYSASSIRDLAERFFRATGIRITHLDRAGLPGSFLFRPAPRPRDILEQLPVSSRTANALRRSVPPEGLDRVWTYGDLLGLRGFGFGAMLDVLEGEGRRRSARPAARKKPARKPNVEDEIERLLALPPNPVELPPAPLLEKALAVIGAELPAPTDEVSKRLIRKRLTERKLDIAAIERAMRFLSRRPPFSVLRREGLSVVVPADRLAMAMLVHGLAVRASVHWGMASLRFIGFQAGTEDLNFVAAIITAKSTFHWADRKQGWFWFEHDGSALVRALERVLAVGRPVKIRDLPRAAFRDWPPELIPTEAALRAFCQQRSNLRVTGSAVSLKSAPDDATALSEEDRSVLSFFRLVGPRLDGLGILTIAEQLGMAARTVLRILRQSALVLEAQPGVFQLIGST